MDDKMNKYDFVNLINLKSQLINFDEEKLIELYKDDYDEYILFLNSVGILINNEPGFLLFNDEYIDKIMTVIGLHRFKTDDTNVKNLINQLIVTFNTITRLPEEEKEEYRYDYILEQEALRDVSFYTEQEFIYALNFDSFFAYALQNSKIDYLKKCDDDMVIMSVNYMMKLCPEFFYDKEIEQNTIERLDNVTPNISKRREKLKTMTENFGKKLIKIFKGE